MTQHTAEQRKALGAFYTDPRVVRFLVRWGMSHGGGRVLDPSCGDGRFLAEAAAQGADALLGCDIDAQAIASTLRRTGPGAELIDRDFFSLDPQDLPAVDLVVGNPPFIRYQRFSGSMRQRALASAARLGVSLSGLSSSWAPFVLHAAQFVRAGGALAMVVPAEIAQTGYGQPTLRALARCFGEIALVVFENNLFADAQTETFLLLAAGRGGWREHIDIARLRDAAALDGWMPQGGLDELRLDDGPLRFAEVLLSSEERAAWRAAADAPHVVTVAEAGRVTNGYVTGANDFFHRTRREALAAGFPEHWLRPTLRRARSLMGLRLTASDLATLEQRGDPHHLVVPREDDAEALARFVAEGEEQGVPKRYKCRTRRPWWRVPGLQPADVLVSYMIGDHPRAAVNTDQATYSNTLHGIRVFDGIEPLAVALALHSSVARLSFEIEGRSYGGGVLKLEPTELQQVRLPAPWRPPVDLDPLAQRVDALLRAGEDDTAAEAVDEAWLRDGLGWPPERLAMLRDARLRLMSRRTRRSKGRNRGSG